MSTSGKPAPKRFAPNAAKDNAGLKNGRASRPDANISLEALQARHRRGISQVGTEDRLTQLSMGRATQFSAILHVVGPFGLAAITLLVLLVLSWLMHFNFWDLFKSHEKQDMEFTLVKDTHAERPDQPKFRGNFNQRAGGKQEKKQPLKAVEDPPQSSVAKKAEAPKPQTPPQKPEPQQKPEPKAEQPQKAPEKKPEPVKQPEKPAFVPTIPTVSKEAPQKPQTSSNKQSQQASAPKAAAQGKSAQEASTGTSFTGASTGSSSMGNPQDGKSATPGVDVAEDIDFGPFMADLEKRIKRNWVPPRGAESRKVVLLFFLSRDGKVVKVEVKKSSGDKEADESAEQAIMASSPFMAFPPKVKEDVLPVEFTFDYNVLNPKNPKQALKW
jgi:TonB family protein